MLLKKWVFVPNPPCLLLWVRSKIDIYPDNRPDPVENAEIRPSNRISGGVESAFYLSAFSTCSAVAVSHSTVIFVPSAVYSVCRTTDRSIKKETRLPRS